MGRFKKHSDSHRLSDEKIEKHKDFKRLKFNYDKVTNPLYKTPLYKRKHTCFSSFNVSLITAV